MQKTEKPARSDETRPTSVQLHGVLVRVLDTGVLLTGESGIGKSEAALDLIVRGHKLVADDAVRISVVGESLVGTPPDLTRDLLEIHGLGIINVREVFGEAAVCDESEIDLSIELLSGGDPAVSDEDLQHEILSRSIPKFVLPISSGRNVATLIETAVRIHRNRGGSTTADLLFEKHRALLGTVG